MKLNLKIDGMGCEHCVKSVREALEEIKGIKISAINLFFGKSPYLFKGNEVNTIKELMLLKEVPKWKNF